MSSKNARRVADYRAKRATEGKRQFNAIIPADRHTLFRRLAQFVNTNPADAVEGIVIRSSSTGRVRTENLL